MSKWFWLFLCISVEMVVVDLYSIVALSSICERERERERGFLEELEVGFKADDERKKVE